MHDCCCAGPVSSTVWLTTPETTDNARPPSALAQALNYAVDQRCDVATLSMGGVPSRAWGEAVDRAYEAGLCLCAAAGNHVGPTPPQTLVYPARYSRVIAVCDAYDAMTSHRPYRPALTTERARGEISRHAGSQFCPRAASALLAVLENTPVPVG